MLKYRWYRYWLLLLKSAVVMRRADTYVAIWGKGQDAGIEKFEEQGFALMDQKLRGIWSLLFRYYWDVRNVSVLALGYLIATALF